MTLQYSIEMSDEGFHIAVETLFKGSPLEGEKLHSSTISELQGKVDTIAGTLSLFKEGDCISSSGIFANDCYSADDKLDLKERQCFSYTIKNQQVGIFPPYVIIEERLLGRKLPPKLIFVFTSIKEAELHTTTILSKISNFLENFSEK